MNLADAWHLGLYLMIAAAAILLCYVCSRAWTKGKFDETMRHVNGNTKPRKDE